MKPRKCWQVMKRKKKKKKKEEESKIADKQ
jgi:hypothetical protein